ncbi:MAG: type II toxin-antitoxin system YafQ family toxin [Candidatus Paceibacterota bacterium]|jgi:mRNA interferase YafQ
MYTIKRTRDFEKSFKKIKLAGLLVKKGVRVEFVIETLALGKKLAPKYKDHQLRGELKGYREYHLASDLLLIYKIEEEESLLILVEIGSHAQVFN